MNESPFANLAVDPFPEPMPVAPIPPKVASLNVIVGDIVARLPDMAKDSPMNAEALLLTLLKPLMEKANTADTLAAVLQKHHDHANESCPVKFIEPDGTVCEIVTDLAEAYQEAELWDQTRDALCDYRSKR